MEKIQRCVKAAEQNEISPEKAVETIDELSEQLENTKRKVSIYKEKKKTHADIYIYLLFYICMLFFDKSTYSIN